MLQGPGENAGAVAIGDGLAVVFKIESHNHPSFIEPYQGAATGVGGILRDVFTMGARPIANLNSLRFGSFDHPRTRYLVRGVVAGIGGYGNCVGVATVGGEIYFDAGYDDNILVNAFTLGLVRADRIFRARAAGVGNPVIYVGSKTGRDGIHGASLLASAEFDETTRAEAPDRAGRRSLHREAADRGLPRADGAGRDRRHPGHGRRRPDQLVVRDGGRAAGSASSIDLDRVPQREAGMTPYEMLLSESQERMLLVARAGAGGEGACEIFAKWDLDAVVVGRVTDDGRCASRWHGAGGRGSPVEPLGARRAGLRPAGRAAGGPRRAAEARPGRAAAPGDYGQRCCALLDSPNLASKRWIYRQYDSLVRRQHRGRPGLRRGRAARQGDATRRSRSASTATAATACSIRTSAP